MADLLGGDSLRQGVANVGMDAAFQTCAQGDSL